MRIISGKAKGTKLYTLDGKNTRPTLDRAKESLFNIINNEIYDSYVLDLFSGSGAIGIEFASRGAKKVYLCDNSKQAINIIKKNIEKTHMEDKIELFNCNYEEIFKYIKKIKFDFIYLDPPYKTDYIKKALEIILNLNIIDEDTLIIAETDEVSRILDDIKTLNLQIVDKRKYGRINLLFLKIK